MVNICRLCLSYVPDLPITVFNDSVSHETKIKCLIPEIDISITPTLDLCNLCLHLLSAAYTFKLGCIRTEDMIKAYLYQNENATINLQDVKEFRNCRIRDTNEILPQSNDIKIEIHEEDIIRNTVTTVENGLNIGFICNKCCKTFENEEVLEFHKKECSYCKCSECTEVFSTKSELNKHFQMHTTTNSYSSAKCYQSFRKPSGLKYINRTTDKSMTCNICLKTYSSLQTLHKHKVVHELLRKRYRCDACNKSFTTSHLFRIHRNLHHKEQHKCKICNQVFNLYYSLRRHMYNKHYKPFICETCGLRCSAKSVLVEHIRVHTGERPFKCEACGKGFAQKSTLTVHIRCVHETAKPFVCEICGKTFAVSGSLTKHMRVHTNPVEKTIPCSFQGCNKLFNTERAASKHRLRHTADKRHKCTLCDKTFLDTPGLKRHMRTHTGERPYACHLCDKTFSQAYNRKIHFKSHRLKEKKVNSKL